MYIGIHWLPIAMNGLRSTMRVGRLTKVYIMWLVALLMADKVYGEYYHVANCSSLLLGQYLCNEINIDSQSQQLKGCSKEGRARITCTSAPGIICRETNNGTFEREVPCRLVWQLFSRFLFRTAFSFFIHPTTTPFLYSFPNFI